MPDTGWTRPTREALIDASSQDMVTSIPASTPYVRGGKLWTIARVIAGTAHTLYGALEYAVRQGFAHLADSLGVVQHATEWGLTRIAAAAADDGTLTFTGTPSTAVPSGTEVVRQDGVVYETTAAGVIGGGGSVALAATCQTSGATGNATSSDGTTYQLAAVISGVDTAVTVGAAFTTGADEETIEELRARVLVRKRQPPQGGAAADYVAWAMEYTASAAVWVVANYLGAGTVGVYFVVDGSGAAIIPDAGDVAAVQALIDATDANGNATRRPVTAAATVVAPTAVTEVFTIAISPDTAANRAAITDALDRLSIRRAGAQPTMSDYWLAVGEADLDSYAITVPTAAATVGTGQTFVRGTITWA